MADGRSVTAISLQNPGVFVQALLVGNVMNIVYALQQCFAKFSLLALYHRLFWVDRRFTVGVWIVAVLQTAWGLVVFLAFFLMCRPMAKLWTPTLPGHCVNINVVFNVYEPINALLDFFVAALALWMLPSLQIKRSTRWHLATLFALGALYVTPPCSLTHDRRYIADLCRNSQFGCCGHHQNG